MLNIRLLKSQMLLAGVSTKDLADAQGWSMSTAYRKLNGHVLFNTKEIQIVVDTLHLNPIVASDIFFAKDLS